ncbi:hypothetical protein FRX31_033205 [Thalictrum thalictroides]|uniref:Major pollen allergen Ole e 6-like n=1 Tax=Thalictrum thalictroides TaxID=46969 RepID=A0A7J6UX76_THATH|nr:hypothetical protein FRX31_033205 [Thalictrum thalictroides]
MAKIVAFFVMCMVLVATMKVEAEPDELSEKYAACFNTCQSECQASGNGYTHCEMKCDEDCSAKELKELLNEDGGPSS